jgi:hypothetical protein
VNQEQIVSGNALDPISAFDMFPQTRHVELVEPGSGVQFAIINPMGLAPVPVIWPYQCETPLNKPANLGTSLQPNHKNDQT